MAKKPFNNSYTHGYYWNDYSFCWKYLEIKINKKGALLDNTEYTFEGQRPDEEVIFVIRRHPWSLSKSALIILILILILALSFALYGFSKITSFVIVATLILLIIYGIYSWFLFSNFLYILTSQRLIIIEQKSLFSRRLSECELEKIQNVTIEVKGFISTMLNFGNIKIATAGYDPAMTLVNVENPYQVQQRIIKYTKRQSTQAPVIR